MIQDDAQAHSDRQSRRESPWVRHRAWAVEQGILTDRGWREGYVAFKPCRWMTRFFFDQVLPLNSALSRLETNAFNLLGISEAFVFHARGFFQQLADLRVTFRKLTREAEHLARGRFGKAEKAQETLPTQPTVETELAALQDPSLAEKRAKTAQ
jgi:hypothetical protein